MVGIFPQTMTSLNILIKHYPSFLFLLIPSHKCEGNVAFTLITGTSILIAIASLSCVASSLLPKAIRDPFHCLVSYVN